MALVRMTSWDGEVVFSVKLEFLFDDSERFLRHFALYCPVEDIVWNVFDIIREFRSWYYL
jgi:hypothetical protein